jgi:hypothetical protein
MDLVTNSVIIADALKFVQQKKKELGNMGDRDRIWVPEVDSISKVHSDPKGGTINKVF